MINSSTFKAKINKKDTAMREALSLRIYLELTLQFLASRDSYYKDGFLI